MVALSGRTDPYARRAVIGLIAIATLVRLRFTFATELGNDEVYYWAYAAFPDWSHFDHPPMVGWVIQLFTLNLALDSEVFIRLAAVVSAAIATWLMYLVGRRLGGERAGLFAAILHTSAAYGSVLAGVVILPDAPLVVFWLLALWLLLEVLPAEAIGPREKRLALLVGAAIGLAILSKYQGVFIGIGAVLYVLLYDRRWLRQPALYGSMALAALIASPILVWNLKNDFISFTYQGGRVAPGLSLRLDYFGTELAGQVLYQNPVTWILIAVAVFAVARGAQVVGRTDLRILLLNALPLWIVFTGFSLFRSTLPHWTGPAYLPLIALAGVYWAGRFGGSGKRGFAAVPWRLNASMILLVVMLAAVTVASQFIPQGYGMKEPETRRGQRDPTMDIFGMDQVRAGVEVILARDVSTARMSEDAPLNVVPLVSGRPSRLLRGHAAGPSAAGRRSAGRRAQVLVDQPAPRASRGRRRRVLRGREQLVFRPRGELRAPVRVDRAAGHDPGGARGRAREERVRVPAARLQRRAACDGSSS